MLMSKDIYQARTYLPSRENTNFNALLIHLTEFEKWKRKLSLCPHYSEDPHLDTAEISVSFLLLRDNRYRAEKSTLSMPSSASFTLPSVFKDLVIQQRLIKNQFMIQDKLQ